MRSRSRDRGLTSGRLTLCPSRRSLYRLTIANRDTVWSRRSWAFAPLETMSGLSVLSRTRVKQVSSRSRRAATTAVYDFGR